MDPKVKIKPLARALSAALLTGVVAGCGGGGGDTASPSPETPAGTTTYVGVFRDAPVSGINYWSPAHSGKTDADGHFNYVENENVNFTLDEEGALKLGGARGKGVITPMDLMSRDADSEVVQAIARMLLLLDEDGDARGGIQLNETIAQTLKGKLQAPNFDFSQLLLLEGDDDHDTPDELTDALVALDDAVNAAAAEIRPDSGGAIIFDGVEVSPDLVTYDMAVSHLVNEDMYRKDVSKTPDMPSAKAKLNVMTRYVPAHRANDEPITDEAECKEIRGWYTDEGACLVKPLVITYTDVDWRYAPGAGADAFGAISRDNGATWKRANLSRTGEREVVIDTDSGPVTSMGESRKPVMQVKGNNIFVAWSDYYCKGGKPRYAVLADEDVNGDGVIDEKDKLYEDVYGVAGSQGYVDYVEQGVEPERLPTPSKVPFSCVWTARGYIDETTGDIQWFTPERLTSGRRDAYQLFVAGTENAGFAVTWQEDPAGLQAGSGAGPGHGFSGAMTSHKTDVWYSYIHWDDFQANTTPVPQNEDPDPVIEDPDGGLGRVAPVNHVAMPVRVSDNDACNLENIDSTAHGWCRLSVTGEVLDDVVTWKDDATGDPVADGSTGATPEWNVDPSELQNCARVVDNSARGGSEYTCVTADGRRLAGNTGASRPNLFLQAYQKDGKYSAWAIFAYEERKGIDSSALNALYPCDTEGEFYDPHPVLGCPTSDPSAPFVYGDVFFEEGKNVYFHSFDFQTPDTIARGDRMNMPAVERYIGADGYYVPTVDGDGNVTPLILACLDDTEALRRVNAEGNCDGVTYGDGVPTQPLYMTDNARRIRFILQGKSAAVGSSNTGQGTTLIGIWKEGTRGKGRPSDIMLWRNTLLKPDGSYAGGNPYDYAHFMRTCEQQDAFGNCLRGVQNMSSVVIGELGEPQGDVISGDAYPKLLSWETDPASLEAALDHPSWQTPMTESRAHRGQIRGDFVVMGYAWTPNWAASRQGHDKYDFFVRRSFDGGQTWTTDPQATVAAEVCTRWDKSVDPAVPVCQNVAAGALEPPRNVSMLRNNFESVVEPRIVEVPGSIRCDSDGNGIITSADAVCGHKELYLGELVSEDKQDKSIFVVSYGLANNTDDPNHGGNGDGELTDDEMYPTDIFYSRTTDFGTTYPVALYVTSDGTEEERWDWLANRKDVEESEVQWRLSPNGMQMYATYLAESQSDYDGPDHFRGSDIWFRKFDYYDPISTDE